MENNLEIGERVKWKVGVFECKGIFIEDNSDSTSLVQMTSKNGVRHICKVDVISSLLERDN